MDEGDLQSRNDCVPVESGELRHTGIATIGDVSWGTHFCQFYQDKQDLIDILVPYFKAGLENNEFCMWVTSDPLRVAEAKAALAANVENLETYIANGQLEILDTEWYTSGGEFESDRVLRSWVDQLEVASRRGFAGLRLTGNPSWLEKPEWHGFMEYETIVNAIIGQRRILAICTYLLPKCGTLQIMDVISNHAFTLVKRADKWEVIAHEDTVIQKNRLRAVLEALPAGVALIDAQGRKIESNAAFEQVWAGPRAATPFEDYADRKAWWVDTGEPVQPEEWASARAVQKGETVVNQEMEIERLDGSRAFVLNSAAPLRDAKGRISGSAVAIRDITELKHAEEALRESESRFRALVTASSDVVYRMSPDWKMMFYLRGRDFIPDTEEPSVTWLQKYIHSDDQAYVMAAINEAIRTKSTFALEHRVRRVDGSLGWTFSRAIPIQNADGEIVEWFGAARDITERMQAELALQESRQELRALAGRLINAEEEERKRISRELHDDLSQKLAMLAFDTGGLVQTPASSMEEIRGRLRNLQSRVVQMSQDVRQIAHQLHPSILEDLGLNSALSELCEEFSTRTGIVASSEQETPPEALPMEVASCLYRVAQEALHNVSKHARASRVRLMIRGSPEGVRLGIRDDGAGFDLNAGRWQHGIGIVSMKERVRLVQGEFSIHSEPGLGTTVSVFVPLPKEIM